VVFDPGKWLYRTRSEGLTGYSCLSVLLPLRVRLGHLSWNNSGGSATASAKVGGTGGGLGVASLPWEVHALSCPQVWTTSEAKNIWKI
jgi:hypothetical protein